LYFFPVFEVISNIQCVKTHIFQQFLEEFGILYGCNLSHRGSKATGILYVLIGIYVYYKDLNQFVEFSLPGQPAKFADFRLSISAYFVHFEFLYDCNL